MAASSAVPKLVKQGFYRIELGKDTWTIPERYREFVPIGSGGFGTVYSAVDTQTKQYVAIKKLARPFEQTPIHAKRAHREVKLMKLLSRFNTNVVELLDVFTPNETPETFTEVYLVTSFMQSDLSKALKVQKLTDKQVQLLVYQILRGLKYIHSAGVLHRDLKPSNIGVSADLEIKILDFGLGRKKKGEMTGYVTTRFWRAPEILLQWMHYGEKVDIWSVGCVLAELLSGQTLFVGSNYKDHLNAILKICGTPDAEFMSKIDSEDASRYVRSMPKFEKRNFSQFFIGANPVAIDLLDKLLHLDPDRRPSAAEALTHPYFGWLHKEDDEPVCNQQYNDIDDDRELDIPGWRKLAFDEINQPYRPPVIPTTLSEMMETN